MMMLLLFPAEVEKKPSYASGDGTVRGGGVETFLHYRYTDRRGLRSRERPAYCNASSDPSPSPHFPSIFFALSCAW